MTPSTSCRWTDTSAIGNERGHGRGTRMQQEKNRGGNRGTHPSSDSSSMASVTSRPDSRTCVRIE